MDLGFETIGNACLICHDKGPVLATDPWIKGSAYFGSWTTSHVIPEEQLSHVKACKYLWISHGHPDHLSQESLAELKDKEILLPDHFGVHRGAATTSCATTCARSTRRRGRTCSSPPSSSATTGRTSSSSPAAPRSRWASSRRWPRSSRAG